MARAERPEITGTMMPILGEDESLVQQTSEILAATREPSPEERKALEAKGFVFVSITPKSLAQTIRENPEHFMKGIVEGVERVGSTIPYSPPAALEIAFNAKRVFLPDGYDKDQPKQLALVEAYSQSDIETEFPDAKALMLPASVYAQADIAYSVKAGKPLLEARRHYARALDRGAIGPTVPRPWYDAVYIGRNSARSKLGFAVGADVNYQNIGVAPGIVFRQPK